MVGDLDPGRLKNRVDITEIDGRKYEIDIPRGYVPPTYHDVPCLDIFWKATPDLPLKIGKRALFELGQIYFRARP
jgi:hypothetical protein